MDRIVRPATRADVAELSEVLGRAFYDDPPFVWVLPDDDVRRRKLAGLFRLLLTSVHLARGGCEVCVRDGRITAGTMWDPPDDWQTSTVTELMQLPSLMVLLGRHFFAGIRGLSALNLLADVHPHEPHWYLGVIGTDPAAQGGGFGRALMESRLSRCDETGIPAYLESSKESNIPYYERFGFEVRDKVTLPRGGPSIYPMWRDPAG
ncbi:GNAT family N-acetyltransferase [Fodinicola feengrottensis]|uniref:GNAT family N-acetyltransferase n=1 Tax=Fodinicola feengrottensis TaxID=435914 RepID=A0ABN2IC16_9ACTN|nr:GNAT family N-acetyltransferase [Fodinicola feengrottensis]